jgi:hypothetical protein
MRRFHLSLLVVVLVGIAPSRQVHADQTAAAGASAGPELAYKLVEWPAPVMSAAGFPAAVFQASAALTRGDDPGSIAALTRFWNSRATESSSAPGATACSARKWRDSSAILDEREIALLAVYGPRAARRAALTRCVWIPRATSGNRCNRLRHL